MPRPSRRRTSRKAPVQSRRDRAPHSRRPKRRGAPVGKIVSRQTVASHSRRSSGAGGLGDRPVTAAGVSVLLGMTTAMVVAGMMAKLDAALTGGFSAGGIVSGAALVALGVGVRVPQRFALWLCTTAWRRWVTRGRTPVIADVLLTSGSSDRPLYWSVVSVVALTAGLLTALAPVYVRAALHFLAWMQAHFLWAGKTLILLRLVTALIAVSVPLMAVGLAISGAHRLSGRLGQWDTRATAWISVGAALGLMAASGLSERAEGADVTLVAAAVPTLLAAVLAAVASTSGTRASGDETVAQPACLPLWSDRWPTLLRGSIVALGGCTAWALSAWSIHGRAVGPAEDVLMPAMLAFLGIGVLWGCREKPSGTRSIGGFGVACAGAGVTTALAVFSMWGRGTEAWAGTVVIACASVGAIGFAVAYGRQTLLFRVGSRTSEGAKMMALMLGCAALTAWILAPAFLGLLGRSSTLMLLAVSLIAVGGTLIIHEPGSSPRTRRLRLCAVFAAMGVLILVVLLAPARPPIQAPASAAEPMVRTAPQAVSHGRGLVGLPDDR